MGADSLPKALVKSPWMAALVLLAQNLAVFWRFWFADTGFPGDFAMEYYAYSAYSMAALSEGVLPQWMPFQGMGFPLFLNVQHTLYYPPLWIFTAPGSGYSLHAAVVLQCLHVLAGSFGMYVLAREVLGCSRYALVAAFAFQFFGGFLSNSPHVDIIRAFAFTPWFLYLYRLPAGADPVLSRRALAIPLLVYLGMTGAYPGNMIAILFLCALLVLMQLAEAWRRSGRLGPVLRRGLAVLGLTLLGLGMATIHFAPLLAEHGRMYRFTEIASGQVPRLELWLEKLPGLIMSNLELPGTLTMTSTFVTAPIVIAALFVPVAQLVRHWKIAGIGIVAAVMAGGSHTPVYTTLGAALPALQWSKYPSSD
jgi:hypothetical protein